MYSINIMSESKKILHLGQLPQKELTELIDHDNTVLATALIYSLSELIASSYPPHMDVDIKAIVQEAASFAIELTNGVRLVVLEDNSLATPNTTLH